MKRVPAGLLGITLLLLVVLLAASTASAQTITHISPTTVTRSGFLEIFGSNFTGTRGKVLVNGVSAPVATWTDTRIAAYVPESAMLGPGSVMVVTLASSNSVPITVTDRAASGRVQWRFRMDAPYSQVRPVVAPDGTIYVIDVYGRLYALAPNGALKWLVNAGMKGLDVGPDGTIYTASEASVRAFYPSGALKWTFVQDPLAFILLGLAVGPDGNIYGVATEGIGVFSLTPQGALRWTNPEFYSRLIVDYGEIAFGSNGGKPQLYFYANNHTRAVRLADGASVFSIAPTGQPVVSPLDGSMHATATAYTPGGQLQWQFFFPISGLPVSEPDLGSDGTHYVVWRSFVLYAINPNGTEKWHVNLPAYAGPPNIDPANSLLVIGSNNTLDQANYIQGVSVSTQQTLWKVNLPPEETGVFNPATGQYGFNQFIDTRAAFTSDSQSAYLVTAIAPGGQVTDRSFLYALTTGGSVPAPAPPPPTTTTLRCTSISLSARQKLSVVGVTGRVLVQDESGALVPGAIVTATWLLPNGTTVTQTASTSTAGVATFQTSGSRGTYRLTVNSIAKSGYVFDAAHSVLSGTITSGTYRLTVNSTAKSGLVFDAAHSVLSGTITK